MENKICYQDELTLLVYTKTGLIKVRINELITQDEFNRLVKIIDDREKKIISESIKQLTTSCSCSKNITIHCECGNCKSWCIDRR